MFFLFICIYVSLSIVLLFLHSEFAKTHVPRMVNWYRRRTLKVKQKLGQDVERALAELDAQFPADKEEVPLEAEFTAMQVNQVAEEVTTALRGFCKKMEVVGSVRRKVETPGDVDILYQLDNNVCSDARFLGVIENLCDDEDQIRGSITLSRTDNPNLTFWVKGIKVQLIRSTPEWWGANMIIFTGSREFNKLIEKKAKRRGYSINWNRLTIRTGGDGYGTCYYDTAFKNKLESTIMEELGLDQYIDPTTRNI